MRLRKLTVASLAGLSMGTVLLMSSAQAGGNSTWKVTVQNLTDGQPMSPPVAATHGNGIRMFKVGRKASAEIEAIAEDGNQGPMFNLVSGSGKVTDAVDVGAPLTRSGEKVGDFRDSATFRMKAGSGDRLSLATMLICTNDGFTGLDRGRLPKGGSRVFLRNGYDAGTEDNTEMSEDIVDPCTALGPKALAGDPNGNENNSVATHPQRKIRLHPNVHGGGDLSEKRHGWDDPVLKVTVVNVDDGAHKFLSRLGGGAEVPPVDTDGSGRAAFTLNDSETALKFNVSVHDTGKVIQAHIHRGSPAENGPVVAFLFGPADPAVDVSGRLARGKLEESDLVGPFKHDFHKFVKELRAGNLYVNIHTKDSPSGELRGQIGAR